MGWLVGPVVFVALAVPSWVFAQTPVQGSQRVRGSSPGIAAAIEQTLERSPTFKQLVTAINSYRRHRLRALRGPAGVTCSPVSAGGHAGRTAPHPSHQGGSPSQGP